MLHISGREKSISRLRHLAKQAYAEALTLISNPLILSSELISNLKFIEHSDTHIAVAVNLLDLIQPTGSVFEIGPGACYFLYLCKHLNDCTVDGVDLESVLFRAIRARLGISITEDSVCAFRKISFNKPKYNYIVAFLTMFNSGWGINAHKFWLQDCAEHLNDNGKIIIHFNNRTFHEEIRPLYLNVGVYSDNLVIIEKESISKLGIQILSSDPWIRSL